MDQSLNEHINILRKRSRLLLAQVSENSKKLKDEIKKLSSHSSSPTENDRNHVGSTNTICKDNIKSWELRNNSSGVGAALCSNYFQNNSNCTVAPMTNTSIAKRIIISSKKRWDHPHPLENVCRKTVVKGCYCNNEVKKVQPRSIRTQHKQQVTCKRCKSHATCAAIPVENNFEHASLDSPISCETLRRVQNIDYAPRSQFLRNVRGKASLLYTSAGKGDCPEVCCRSRCCCDPMAKRNIYDSISKHRLETRDKTTQTTYNQLERPISSESNTEYTSLKDNEVNRFDKEVQVETRRQTNGLASKGSQKKPEHSRTRVSKDSHPKQYSDTIRTEEQISERDMRELRKFREQNYFDTHGSSHTLSSSKSSGSLEQYLLNDRLFPEPVKKIHKKDLVVTMPPCATTQLKRMHYFPRYIVRQEKHNFNAASKKKRCQCCPLTGHAIDLGITKLRSPLNSLALKYQKRLP